MIKSDTYLAENTARRNLLASFTGADLNVSLGMSTEEIDDRRFIDLVNRWLRRRGSMSAAMASRRGCSVNVSRWHTGAAGSISCERYILAIAR